MLENFSLPLLFAALIPAFILLIYFVKSDRFPEPTHLIVKTFFWGFAIVVPILIIVLPIQDLVTGLFSGVVLKSVAMAFILAAIPEELFKYLVLKNYCAKQTDFDEPMDGIVYGATVSLGFAALENVMYVIQGGMEVAVLRMFTAVPMHAACGGVMGYFFSQSHFEGNQSQRIKGLYAAIIYHGLYNSGLFCAVNDVEQTGIGGLGVLFSIVVLIYLVVKVRSYVKELRAEQDQMV